MKVISAWCQMANAPALDKPHSAPEAIRPLGADRARRRHNSATSRDSIQ
jgi:hypothetical protein